MVEKGMFDGDAVRLFGRFGPFTSAAKVPLTVIPSVTEWNAALGHQGIIRISPQEAAAAVREAIEAALNR